MHAHALIMAAGTSDRFGSSKLFTEVGGRPVLLWSVRALASDERISGLTVVAHASHLENVKERLARESFGKPVGVVAGGETRQASVLLGLQSLDGEEYVFVHDAARPCLSQALIDRLFESLEQNDAVVPAVGAVDTLIRDADGRVDAILDRAHIAGVQTPQCFKTELLLRAHREAASKEYHAGDDGTLVLALKHPVATVPGERANIKITYSEDVALAEALIRRQHESHRNG